MNANEQAIRDGYDAFGRGDLDAVRETMSPEVTWSVPGRSELAGQYRGIDAVLGYFGELFTRSEGTFRAELLECGEIGPDLVAALVQLSGTMPGGSFDNRLMQLFRLADGRTVEALNFPEDLYAMDEATGAQQITLPDARSEAQPAPAG